MLGKVLYCTLSSEAEKKRKKEQKRLWPIRIFQKVQNKATLKLLKSTVCWEPEENMRQEALHFVLYRTQYIVACASGSCSWQSCRSGLSTILKKYIKSSQKVIGNWEKRRIFVILAFRLQKYVSAIDTRRLLYDGNLHVSLKNNSAKSTENKPLGHLCNIYKSILHEF